MGFHASWVWLAVLAGALAVAVLLSLPSLGLIAIVVFALVAPFDIGTGTEVALNPVTLVVPLVVGLWLLDRLRRKQLRLVSSRVNLPLALFLAAGLLSLLIGTATWDPLVPHSNAFILVQLAQWAIFALSAAAFWLTGNMVHSEAALRRLTSGFLLLAGGIAILRLMPELSLTLGRFTTLAFIRAPLWILLVGLAAGQLMFNPRLSLRWRIFLVLALVASLIYAFVQQQEAVSNWVALAVVLGMLVWLRFPRLRWPLVGLVALLSLLGVFFPLVYDFAGGAAEWQLSGGSRLALTGRVLDVSMHNPITGLGPAAYRRYAAMEPLIYGNAVWTAPRVSSHNNYVDLFAHVGLIGLAAFFWFVLEMARLGARLHRRYSTGFLAGYANGMIAVGIGALVVMLLADWILPFVYNIGFPGFQASVLVWLFLGGLVSLENLSEQATVDAE